MKIYKKLTILILLVFCATLRAETNTVDRILILGFISSSLTDVEDRYLRESIMKKLNKNGKAIVPIMEIESYFTEEKRDIRKTRTRDLWDLSKKFGASHIVSGRIIPAETLFKTSRFVSGKKFLAEISIYVSKKNLSVKRKIFFEAEGNYHSTLEKMSEIIKSDFLNFLENEK